MQSPRNENPSSKEGISLRFSLQNGHLRHDNSRSKPTTTSTSNEKEIDSKKIPLTKEITPQEPKGRRTCL